MFPVQPTQPSPPSAPIYQTASRSIFNLLKKVQTAWRYARIETQVKLTLGPKLYCEFQQASKNTPWDQQKYDRCVRAVEEDLHPSEPPCS